MLSSWVYVLSKLYYMNTPYIISLNNLKVVVFYYLADFLVRYFTCRFFTLLQSTDIQLITIDCYIQIIIIIFKVFYVFFVKVE